MDGKNNNNRKNILSTKIDIYQNNSVVLSLDGRGGHITASGDISASGIITGNSINVNGTNVLLAGGVDMSTDTNLAVSDTSGQTGIDLTYG